MLGKMLLQGLAAAAIIAGAAAAYSASANNAPVSNAPQNAVSVQAPQASPDTGYIQPDARPAQELNARDRHRYGKDKRKHDDHARKRGRDGDDCDDDHDDRDDRHKRRHSRSHDRGHDRH